MLEADRLACGYGRRVVLQDISFSLRPGELLCLLGPNGIGKTTLFKTLLGLMPRLGGDIRIDGEPVARWSRRRFARRVGYVPQTHAPPFPFRVLEVVAMGRTAHLGPFGGPRSSDFTIAGEALESLGITHLAGARYTEISDGQRQLVLIARALAQAPRILVMDEPTASLDYGNQLKLLSQVRRIADGGDRAVILTTHHPDHALMYGSRALVLDKAGRHAIGHPAEVVTPAYLRAAYEVDADIHTVPGRNGRPVHLCVPRSPTTPE